MPRKPQAPTADEEARRERERELLELPADQRPNPFAEEEQAPPVVEIGAEAKSESLPPVLESPTDEEIRSAVEDAIAQLKLNLPGSCINCGQSGEPIQIVTVKKPDKPWYAGFQCPACKYIWTPKQEAAPFRHPRQ
ncbi:MAG TPA: hypothetical protein VJG32_17965 [Anaerolineae bacterium]|nr:hypothetical protein [Anaerolineae bacterium]